MEGERCLSLEGERDASPKKNGYLPRTTDNRKCYVHIVYYVLGVIKINSRSILSTEEDNKIWWVKCFNELFQG